MPLEIVGFDLCAMQVEHAFEKQDRRRDAAYQDRPHDPPAFNHQFPHRSSNIVDF